MSCFGLATCATDVIVEVFTGSAEMAGAERTDADMFAYSVSHLVENLQVASHGDGVPFYVGL